MLTAPAPHDVTALPHWTTPGIRVRIAARPAPPPTPSENEMLHPTENLPPEHRARYQLVVEGLDDARQVDLTTITPARLALAFEQLRSTLALGVDLIDDLASSR
ncbi:hypothetical protein [Kitasatospora purpeofusca]|uniref:hypothetical protein n=1 Tax=Kitasatospora purpeofusca TaxID=67352 RepID=UPI003813051F